MLRAGDVISKTELTERLYDQDFERDSNVIEVFIGRLRRKLDPTDSCSRSRPCAAAATASRWRATRAAEAPDRAVHSLSRRLLISVSVPLVLFFGAMMLVFDASFRDLSERSLQRTARCADGRAHRRRRAAARRQRTRPSAQTWNPASTTPRSGLYAQIRVAAAQPMWRSPSTAGTGDRFRPAARAGERELHLRDRSTTTAWRSRAAASRSRMSRRARAT